VALEVILTGRRLAAQEAAELRLVNRVVPDESLLQEALSLARDLSRRPPLALRYAKEAVKRGLEMRLEDAIGLEIDLMMFLWTTNDHAEAAAAFVEKRQPVFEGR
jgi:enoyl-CoA hydratase